MIQPDIPSPVFFPGLSLTIEPSSFFPRWPLTSDTNLREAGSVSSRMWFCFECYKTRVWNTRVFGRAGDSLKVVEPSHLFYCALWNEHGGEILASGGGGVVAALAVLDQGHHRLALFDCLCRSPLGPSSSITSTNNEMVKPRTELNPLVQNPGSALFK